MRTFDPRCIEDRLGFMERHLKQVEARLDGLGKMYTELAYPMHRVEPGPPSEATKAPPRPATRLYVFEANPLLAARLDRFMEFDWRGDRSERSEAIMMLIVEALRARGR